MKRLVGLILLFALAGFGAGCASQPARFYTLTPTAEPAQVQENYSVAVGPIYVPPAVDRPQLVMNTGLNEVKIDEFNRWASPLQTEIAWTVAENVGRKLGIRMVGVYPQGTAGVGASYRVMIDVVRFESSPGQNVSLDALWTVRGPKEKGSRAGRTTLTERVADGSTAGLVAAHSRALGRLSGEVAEAIRDLERGGR